MDFRGKICASLALMLVCSMILGGCAQTDVLLPYKEGKAKKDVTEVQEVPEEPEEAAPPVEVPEEPVEELEPDIEETVEEPPAEEEPEVEKPRVFEPGVVSGQTYENKTLELGLKVDPDWTYATAEEIADINGMKENATTANVTAFLEDPEEYVEMDVLSGGIGNEISISVINSTFIASEDLMQNAEAACSALEEQLIAAKYENVESKIHTVSFLGEALPASIVSCTYEGTAVNEMQIHNIKNGYFFTIMVLCFGEDNPEDMLTMFYSLNEEGT